MSDEQKSKRTTTPSKLAQRRKERQSNRGNSDPADYAVLDSEILAELIEAFTRTGGVVGFGYTRDGGAYYISYFADGERDAIYIRPTEDVEARLVDEIKYWNDTI